MLRTLVYSRGQSPGDGRSSAVDVEAHTPARCNWANGSIPLAAYHDAEWGVPVHDDRKHFEFLVLEGAQAGLSWLTILNRRDGYRRAFAEFDPERVSEFKEADVQRLLSDTGIIRNRLKILSAIGNAQQFLKIQREFGSFDTYVWDFVGGRPIQHGFKIEAEIPATSPESDALSKDLRERGFKFVGSTICYAHMQAVGLVNDHVLDCFRYAQVHTVG